MSATAPRISPTYAEEPPGREIAELVARDFDEARRMLADGYREMAVVRAVGSFEWLIKQALLEPYLRTAALAVDGEIASLMVRGLLSSQGWDEMPKLFKACWGIEVGRLPLWKDFRELWRVRSAIVHKGARCEAIQAQGHIESCTQLLEALLLARSEANRDCG